MQAILEEYAEEIYRPGEDVSALNMLSDDEKSERRREIEELFRATSNRNGDN